MDGMKIDLPFLSQETDRHGNVRLYVRRYGSRIRLRVGQESKDFVAAYQKALDEISEQVSHRSTRLPALAGDPLFRLGGIQGAGPRLANDPPRLVESCVREPVRDGSIDFMADCPLSYVSPAKVKRLRDLKRGLPGAGTTIAASTSPPCSAERERPMECGTRASGAR